MKISNQLKVGLLTITTLALCLFGYNFLKNKNLFTTNKLYYAKFKEIGELNISSPVRIKGYKVGVVASIKESGPNLEEIIVGIEMKKEINIGKQSLAFVNTSLLGVSTVDIRLDNSNGFYKLGDTITSSNDPKMLDELQKKISPIMGKVDNSLGHLDSLMVNANSVIDENLKANLKASLQNVTKLTTQLSETAASLQSLISSQTGTIATTMNSVKQFSGNLNGNNDKINAIMESFKTTADNLKTTTANFKDLKLDATMAKVNTAVDELTKMLKSVNNPDGSIGKLLNDKLLYDRINNTIRSVNVLMDDFKTNPKRYVNISVFGKKNKGGALTAPIINADSSLLKK
jgi:phospholipid/cholesterol/gamma-HCH transport system substrate-binding protein